MSDSDRDPADLLDLTRESGRILCGDARFLLLSAEAVGRLRRELYEILGPIMAHELMFRFGFEDGSCFARIVREQMPGLTPREALEKGPIVHTLEGMARVKVQEVRFGDEFEGMSGIWENSFEAEQSKALLGPVEWTGCWILTGFASGYASETVGRDLLCVENTCRAKGDDLCRFEIHPAERFPGLARKVRALRDGIRMKERMQAPISRLKEKALTSTAHLARILQDSADAILTVDENETIRTWNRGAEELLGYTAEEVIGRRFDFLVPRDLLERGEIEKIKQETAGEGSLRNYRTRRVTKSGEEVHVSLTRTSVYDADGRYAGASAILRDITERKRLVEQLIQKESLAEVGELAAQVAHEIKNPLAGISAAIQLISESTPPSDPRRSIFYEILDHTRRLDNTVRSLLRFTKPVRPNLARTDLALMIESALATLQTSEDLGGVTVLREISPDVAKITVDSQQLIQVFQNLFLNAAQALTEDRIIIVRAGRLGDQVLIEVQDRGVGMTPEVLRQVFKPFFTKKHKGTGLGLAIARKIIDGHGGTIRVKSEVDRGTTVEILLPHSL